MNKYIQYLDKTYWIVYDKHPGCFNEKAGIPVYVSIDLHFVCRNETGIINYCDGVEVFALNKKIAVFANRVSIVLGTSAHSLRQIYECLPTIHYILFNVKSILLHSASIVHDGKCMLFVGESGAGKTTFANLAIKNKYSVLSDELNIIVFDDDNIKIAGSMINSVDFIGGACPNRIYECNKVFFLNKGGTSKIIVNESKDNLFYFLNQYKIQQFKVYNYLDFIRVGQQFQYFDLYFMKDFFDFLLFDKFDNERNNA